MTKPIIRQSIKKLRSELSPETHLDLSQKIVNQLFMTDEYINAKVIYVYVDTKNEVSTKNLIAHAFKSGKDVAVPKIENGIMNFYQIHSFDELEPGYFGILEPISKSIPKTPDIVIVPGVAFSLRKERLGYGGGFYDSFLKDNYTKIALAYEFQLMNGLPIEEHDVLMDMIITEERIII